MKFLTLALMMSLSVPALSAQEGPLPAPQKEGGMSLMESLAARRTVRDLDKERALEPQMLANLLWAANGISSPDGKRTSPTARNLQPYELYIAMESGVYYYDAPAHALKKVSDENLVQTAKCFGSAEILLVHNPAKQPQQKNSGL